MEKLTHFSPKPAAFEGMFPRVSFLLCVQPGSFQTVLNSLAHWPGVNPKKLAEGLSTLT